MNRKLLAAWGLCFALLPLHARAIAFAEVRVTHITQGFYTTDPALATLVSSQDTNIVVSSTSGAPPDKQVGMLGGPQTYHLVPDQTLFYDYTYSITVSDDGLQAGGPMHDFCAGLDFGCFGAHSQDGREVAWAALLVGYVGGHPDFPAFAFDIHGATVSLVTPSDASPDFLTQSGIVRASFLTHTPLFTTMTASFFATTFADGAAGPIPEPDTYALLLAGLATLAVLRRRMR